MDMNLFSIIWICGFCFVGIMCIALAMYIYHKSKRLIEKCTITCKGTLVELEEKMREWRDEDGISYKKKNQKIFR